MSRGDGPLGDDRPSEAVLDELLAMFQADDRADGADIDLESPEVDELLSGPKFTVVDEDELPDVSYLDELPVEDDGDRSVEDAKHPGGKEPVFIDDDSKLAEVVGSAEAARATGIEPKLRQRRAAVRKAQGPRRLRWVLLAVAVLVLVIGGLAVLGSPLFAIEDIEVSNAVYSREALAPIVEDMEGEPTLRLDTGAFEERIERIPWVEDARIRTGFPDSASIEIRERRPAATFRGADGAFRVIDDDGRVLDVVGGQPADLLLVRSDDPPDTPAGDVAPDGFTVAATMAGALTPSVRPATESVDVANDGSDVRLRLVGGTEVLFGPGEDLADKLVRLETVIDMVSERPPARIDVSTEDVTVQESG